MPSADPAAADRGLPCAPEDIDSVLSEASPAVTAVLARTPGRVLVLGAGGKMGLHLSVMLQRALGSLGRTDDLLAVSRFRTLRDREDVRAGDVHRGRRRRREIVRADLVVHRVTLPGDVLVAGRHVDRLALENPAGDIDQQAVAELHRVVQADQRDARAMPTRDVGERLLTSEA
ncbi:MAG: hypothetical protein ACKOTF_18545 [Opitutaceae bacterium]